MTKEEKIKGLYGLKEYLMENSIELDGHKSLPITLIDYAIEALKQDPCEDAISRKAVITEIKKWWRTALDAEGSPLICETIKKMPSVTPTQKMKAEIIDDLIKKIKDAEKKFDDKGAHHVSAGFYYARKELKKMKGI